MTKCLSKSSAHVPRKLHCEYRRQRSLCPRRAFVLPIVLVALLLVATLTGATHFSAWRAMRSARLGWNGERALLGADEIVSAALATWNSEAFAAQPIGARWQRSMTTVDGAAVVLNSARLGPLDAVLEATMTSRIGAAVDTASRRVMRVIALSAPEFPLRGALTVLGAVQITGAATLDGRDVGWPGDGCGSQRDTASVSGVHATDAVVDMIASIRGAPPLVVTGAMSRSATNDGIAFDSAWLTMVPRITRREAWNAPSALVSAPAWTARILAPIDSSAGRSVVIIGTARHDGMLVIDGDLVLRGDLEVQGVLVVHGALDAANGTLVVNGAVIARDRRESGSRLSGSADIRYSPCTTRRALATVARPSTVPFALWTTR